MEKEEKMGSKVHSRVEFENTFKGTGKCDNGHTVPIGSGGAAPYDLLTMALSSCLYSTFLDIMAKKKIEFSGAEIDVSGEKRDEVPTTLKYCKVTARVRNVASNSRAGVEKSFELATKYCSVYQTLSKVSQMDWEVIFE